MWRVYMSRHRTFGPWYERVQRQPGWVVKLALTATVLVVVVPIVVLTLAALVVGLVVFTIAGLVAVGMRVLGGGVGNLFAFGRRSRSSSPGALDDGRRNVRVLRR